MALVVEIILRTFSGKAKKGMTSPLAPRPALALADGGVALAPFACLEGGERSFGCHGIDRAVNVLQGAGQRLAMLPQHEVHRVPEQVDDAGLDDRFGEHGGDRIGDALETLDDG